MNRLLSRVPEIERDQFALLSRDGVRHLLNVALVNREGDPSQFALWSLVLLATPPAMYAFRRLMDYSALRFQRAAVIEHAIQVDRMFFLLYGMLVAAAVAAATWEALLPDRADQEVVGSLPVRPRTVAAARLAAALRVATVASGAISLPAAVFLALAAPSHHALGWFPVVFVAHVVSTLGASLFAFLLLLAARALVAIAFGARVSEQLATGMQLLTVAALAEVFFFIPGLIPRLIDELSSGDRSALLIPSMPFAALYAWLVGLQYPALGIGAAMAPLVLVGAAAVVVLLYLLPARMYARRALESSTRERVGLLSTLTRGAVVMLPASPPVRSIAVFATTTLLRSRRHRLIVTAYAGLALAFSTMTVLGGAMAGPLAPAPPGMALLSVPLLAMFFSTIGLQAAFGFPSDAEANWPFRLSTPGALVVGHATACSLFLLSMLPTLAGVVIALWLGGTPRATSFAVVAFDALSGFVLIEASLQQWRIIPFACSHPNDAEAVRSHWLARLVPLIGFVFVNAAIQAAALRADALLRWYLASLVVLLLVLHVRRRDIARRLEVQFDAVASDAMATLSLSEAAQ
jgi:hypothetical protein